MGENVDIGAFTYINAAYGVEIQDNVQIGSHVSIYSHNSEDDTHGAVVIRRNSKIGSHCVIFPEVEIGENARVGAHSVVKVDVPDDVTYTDHVLVKECKHT